MKEKTPKGWAGMEGKISFILMKAGVSQPEIDQCIEWAFGPRAWYKPISPDWINYWNKNHPGYFKIRKEDSFVKILFVVGNAFLDYRKKHLFGTRGIIINPN